MKLTTRQKKYLYWLVSIVSIVTITISVYYSLGGFEEIKVVKSGNNIYNVAGKEYKGRIKNDSVNIVFNEIRSLVVDGKINGEMCVVNYHDEGLNNNEIHQFIGILLGDEISEIPSGLTVREIKAATTFKVGLGMHPLVMSNTKKIEATIQDYATQNGFELEDYTLEILFQDNSVMVEMFAK
ncbi:hypothetical protein [Reichenbachiella sp. MALMAid0571]|uniref:hypothetical protein n=1 Tax=Reichenbachiella sp. MALMAid0571 TaxID=3143939 RepID=UPI0032DF9499